jgi:hypothetical protein
VRRAGRGVRGLARLEQADECADKRTILAELDAAGDPRVLHGLRSLAATPTDACRKGRARSDCLGCLRDALADAIARLERAPGG